MQLLVWEDRFSVGVREFDQHHKILFEMINSLIIAKEEKSGGAVVKNTLDQLALYTAFHFAAEESMLEYFGYDGLDDHKLEHGSLLEQVQVYQAQLAHSGSVSIDELLDFLSAWLLDHTLGMDQLYKPFLAHHHT